MMNSMKKTGSSIHYAWVICAAGTLLFFVLTGLSNNAYAVYQPFISDSFSLTQTALSFMNTCRNLAAILSTVVLAAFYRKFNLKNGLTIAASFTLAGFAVMALAKSYPALVIGCALTGFGNQLGGIVPVSLLMDRWFLSRRKLAVSICSSASGIATFIAPKFITAAVEKFGLSSALLGQTVLMLLLILVCFLLFVNDPKEKGMKPYQDGSAEKITSGTKKEPAPLSKANRFLAYATIFLTGGLCGCAMAVLPLVATSFGYSSSVMATTVSIGGLSLLLGKLLYGWLCEKITQFKTVLLFGSLMITGLSLLIFGGRSTAFLYAGSVLWVGSLAMIAIGLVAWPADWFSEAEQISCRQRFIFLHTGGTFAFSIVPGLLADRFGGSYLPTVLIFLAEAVITLTVVVVTYRAAGRTRG